VFVGVKIGPQLCVCAVLVVDTVPFGLQPVNLALLATTTTSSNHGKHTLAHYIHTYTRSYSLHLNNNCSACLLTARAQSAAESLILLYTHSSNLSIAVLFLLLLLPLVLLLLLLRSEKCQLTP
jgi:hypothetical protein